MTARRRIAAFVGAEPRTTIFTKNVTEAINLVAYAWGRANVGPGDAVLITQMEHHANLVPWQVLCARARRRAALPGGRRARRALARAARSRARTRRRQARRLRARLKRARHDQPGRARSTARARAAGRGLADRRRAGGAAAAGRRRRARRRLLRLDGPQGARADGHRRAARRRASCSRQMEPFLTGGDMIASVDLAGGHVERAAVQVRGRHAADRRGGRPRRRRRLPRRARHGARARARARADGIHARAAARGARPARRRPAARPSDRGGARVVHDRRACTRTTSPSWPTAAGVCIRAGHHCAQPLMRCLGVGATARASVSASTTTRADVDALIDALQAGREVFGL